MTVHIRPATLGDAGVIADFNRRLAWESEGLRLDEAVLAAGVQALLADASKGWYLVAEESGTIVGQVMVTFEWSDWRNGWFWWIQSVYVREDVRRRGVFRSLYAHVFSLAQSKPEVIGLRLYVENENTRAQQTYLKLGMQAAGYSVLQKSPLR